MQDRIRVGSASRDARESFIAIAKAYECCLVAIERHISSFVVLLIWDTVVQARLVLRP